MRVFFVLGPDRAVPVEVDPSAPLGSARAQLSSALSPIEPGPAPRLVFAGRILGDDTVPISDYGVSKDSSITVVPVAPSDNTCAALLQPPPAYQDPSQQQPQQQYYCVAQPPTSQAVPLLPLPQQQAAQMQMQMQVAAVPPGYAIASVPVVGSAVVYPCAVPGSEDPDTDSPGRRSRPESGCRLFGAALLLGWAALCVLSLPGEIFGVIAASREENALGMAILIVIGIGSSLACIICSCALGCRMFRNHGER
eukprot:m51a1_g2766 hypothetical protein (252) ;mRNA; r:998739-999573